MRLTSIEVLSVDLPFRQRFAHAAYSRETSASVWLKVTTAEGITGYGECLPRRYVTGETQGSTYEALERLAPILFRQSFPSPADIISFLETCDGLPPPEWGLTGPQSAAWCAVDLALLDTAFRAAGIPVPIGSGGSFPPDLRYAGAVSSGQGMALLRSLLKLRLFGMRDVKLKLGTVPGRSMLLLCRMLLGRRCTLRTDANMAWDESEALSAAGILERAGVKALEQPVAAEELEVLSRLQRATSMDLVADESVVDKESLQSLIAHTSCRMVNIRISKCGGLVASLRRSREALAAGLKVQIGCQVGESSLLSAAQLKLICALQEVSYAEGCFGTHLLVEDPARPLLQFGFGGQAPELPGGPGLGVTIDEATLKPYVTRRSIFPKVELTREAPELHSSRVNL